MDAAIALNKAIEAGWPVARIDGRFALGDMAGSHELVEGGELDGRVIVTS
jgi:hypothetical protein